MNKHVLIIDPVHPVLIEQLEKAGYACVEASQEDDAAVLSMLPSALGLVMRSRWPLDQAWLEANQHLRFIGRVGAGLEHIDVQAASFLGIQVLSSPEGNRQAVAEHALGILLSLLHNVRKANEEVRKGVWQRKPNEGTELQGKTVAIIGYGNAGSAFAQLLSGFGVRTIAYDKYKHAVDDPFVTLVPMEEVHRTADVVSLHIPQDKDTVGLVDSAWIDAFEKAFLFINTSRGGIVEDDALLTALERGKVVGAALDVLSIERADLSVPPWDTLPTSSKALIEHPKVLVTPHIAGLSRESYKKLSQVMADKIIAALQSA
jgi:D-3-phosphoglycerate dehydrogenase